MKLSEGTKFVLNTGRKGVVLDSTNNEVTFLLTGRSARVMNAKDFAKKLHSYEL